MNLFENIYVHSIRLISEFPRVGVKFSAKIEYHFSNITFSDKSGYDRIFHQVTHKVGESVMIYIKRFQNAQALSVAVENY